MSGARVRQAVPDALLVAQCRAGNARAFNVLVVRHWKRVLAVGMRFFHNAADAEDLAQETFLKAWLHLGSFRGTSSFATWLLRIAATTAMNRRNRRHETESLAESALPSSPLPTPAERFERLCAAQAVSAAVGSLPDAQTLCLWLYFACGLTSREIAARTGRPENTVKSLLLRAKRLLARRLHGWK